MCAHCCLLPSPLPNLSVLVVAKVDLAKQQPPAHPSHSALRRAYATCAFDAVSSIVSVCVCVCVGL